ncbi:MAG: hypothetical protein MK086_12645 [Flavobacteriales bacterium]|nr:hypothetical protein [Flavobacteriales bacterium]
MKKTSLIIVGCLLSLTILSQGEISDLRFFLAAAEEINVTELGVDDLENPLVDADLHPQMNYQASFYVSSILGVDSVVVEFGSTPTGSEITSVTLAFDEVAPAPFDFSRDDDKVTVDAGVYPFVEEIFCRVHLIYEDGTTTTPVLFPEIN